MTLEVLVPVVNVSHVSLQVGGYREASVTVFAGVRLFPRVRPEMSRQVGRPGKCLATIVTGVPC